MKPLLSLVGFALLTVFLFRSDRKVFGKIPAAIWFPLIYFFILASRLPSQWLAQTYGGTMNQLEEGSPLDRVIYIGLIIGSVWVLYQRNGFRTLFRDNWPLTLYLAYTAVSVLWSDFPLVSFKRWFRDLGLYLTIGVIITDPDVTKAVRLLFRRFSYLVLPLSTIMIKWFPNLGRGFDQWTGQAFNHGISTSKNGLGALALVCSIYLVWEFVTPALVRRSWKETAINAALLGNCLWLLMLSSSATSLLCFLIGSGLLILMYLRPFFMSPRTIGWVFLCTLLLYVPADYLLNLSELVVQSTGRNTTLTGRTDVWAEVLKLANSPILGEGYESFWLGERLAHMWEVFFWGPTQAHNGYLEVYLNLGSVGLVVVLCLLVGYYVRISRALAIDRADSRIALAFFAVFLFYNLTEAAIRSSVIWYTFLTLAMGVSAGLFETAAGHHTSFGATPTQPATQPVPHPRAWKPRAIVQARSARHFNGDIVNAEGARPHRKGRG